MQRHHLVGKFSLKRKGKSTPTIGYSNRNVRKKSESVKTSLGQRLGMSIQAHHQQTQLTNLSASLQRLLKIIASSSSSTPYSLSKLTQIQTPYLEKSSHSLGKLLEKNQKMLLMASSRGNAIPTQLNDKAMAFFALSNFSKA